MLGLGGATGVVVMLLVGLVVGGIAKILVPGKDPGGVVTTSILGVLGSFIGGWLGGEMGTTGGFALSVAGAILILLGYRVLRRLDRS